MEFSCDEWMAQYLSAVRGAFGERLRFVGLQGSRARGEATDESDIDAVLLLDRLDAGDLRRYSELLDALPHRDMACGFIAGAATLASWDRADLFQFYHDTAPIWGSLDDLLPRISAADARRAVHVGACNLYHACVHNLIHEKDGETLRSLLKSAGFTVQALHFCRTGDYIRKRADLLPLLPPTDQYILQIGAECKGNPHSAQDKLAAWSEVLLSWAEGLIEAYAEGQMPDTN